MHHPVKKDVRIAALIEAATVTGPARNLLDFAAAARVPDQNGSAGVTIMTFHRSADPAAAADTVFLQAAHARGIETHVIREKGRFDFTVLRSLTTALERIQPDILQTHGLKSHFIAALLQSQGKLRVPWLAFHHGYTAEDFKMLVYNQLNRWSLPRARRVVTVCSPFAEMLVKSGVRREKIDVLPNSLPVRPLPAPEQAAALRTSLGIDAAERVVLAVGRFSSEKGHEDLLRAIAQLGSKSTRLVLVGDGLLRAKLEGLATSLGIADRVVFAGQQKDVAPYYAMADLFVLPSHSEGSPNVLLEAMAAGLPIVSTRVGGVPDTVTDGESALLVPARKPAQMAAAMERLLTDRELAQRLGHNGADRLAAAFRPENYRASLLNIYAKVLEAR